MYQKKEIDKAKAYEYYCKGLNSKEIGKLLDCSFRTIQNYMSAENWKQKRTNAQKKKLGVEVAKPTKAVQVPKFSVIKPK